MKIEIPNFKPSFGGLDGLWPGRLVRIEIFERHGRLENGDIEQSRAMNQ